jgi:hypothetical protein
MSCFVLRQTRYSQTRLQRTTVNKNEHGWFHLFQTLFSGRAKKA